MRKLLPLFLVLAACMAAQSDGRSVLPRSTPGPRPEPIPDGIPSGQVPVNCRRVAPSELLACYLNDTANFQVQYRIKWRFNKETSDVPNWKDWPAWAKQDLNLAYLNTVAWYNGGMNAYPGTLPPEPVANLNEAAYIAGQSPSTILDDAKSAWPLYIGYVALTLASEIHGWVPWSIHNYDHLGMHWMFDSGMLYQTSGSISGWHVMQAAVPSNAITVFKFLKQNNLIGHSRMDTIDRVLNWSRWNLSHMFGAYTAQNYYNYWQYWGKPPVSRIIEGTYTADSVPSELKGLQRWTQGCYGTTALLIWVFKAVNIPVTHASVGYHLAPHFVAEKLYLSHGDDPYSSLSKGPRPAKELLISEATYQSWFPANDVKAADKNVGRQVLERNILYPSPELVAIYQQDLLEGLSHSNGRVYKNYYSQFYSVPQLEAKGLWVNLDKALSSIM